MIPPFRICLSGGGIKGFAHVGALEVLEERGLLRAVHEYIGISAGALVAMCLCIGCSLSEIRSAIERLDFALLRHLEPETVLQFPESYGLDSGEQVMKLLGAIFKAKGLPADCTFRQLAAVGGQKLPRLRVYATNLHTCEVAELSEAVTPDMEIRLAVRASMCIPIYFSPVREPVTGHFLVDGGVICHSPFQFLTADERETTLAITFSQEHKPTQSIPGLLSFLKQLYYAVDYHHNERLVGPWSDRTMFLRVGGFSSLNFEAGAEEKGAIMAQGRRDAEEFLAGGQGGQRQRKLSRRYSVA